MNYCAYAFNLVSLAVEGSFAYIPNSGSNNVSNMNKSDDAIKTYDETTEINPQYSKDLYSKKITLYNYIFSL